MTMYGFEVYCIIIVASSASHVTTSKLILCMRIHTTLLSVNKGVSSCRRDCILCRNSLLNLGSIIFAKYVNWMSLGCDSNTKPRIEYNTCCFYPINFAC